jgi:hypothetical protein
MGPSNGVKVDADTSQTAMMLLFCQTRDGGLVLVLPRIRHGGQGRGADGYNLAFASCTEGVTIQVSTFNFFKMMF